MASKNVKVNFYSETTLRQCQLSKSVANASATQGCQMVYLISYQKSQFWYSTDGLGVEIFDLFYGFLVCFMKMFFFVCFAVIWSILCHFGILTQILVFCSIKILATLVQPWDCSAAHFRSNCICSYNASVVIGWRFFRGKRKKIVFKTY
jgi:hypothetical protein